MEPVDVDQPRHRKSAIEIHHLGGLTGNGLYVSIRADDQELAVLDRHRLGPGLGLADGVDPAVGVGGVSLLSLVASGSGSTDHSESDSAYYRISCIHELTLVEAK